MAAVINTKKQAEMNKREIFKFLVMKHRKLSCISLSDLEFVVRKSLLQKTLHA